MYLLLSQRYELLWLIHQTTNLCHHLNSIPSSNSKTVPSYWPVLNKLPNKSAITFPWFLGIAIPNQTSPTFKSAWISQAREWDTSFQGTSCNCSAYCFLRLLKNSGAPRWHATINRLRKFIKGNEGNISTPSITLWGGTLSPEINNPTNVFNETCASRIFCKQRYGSTARER